MKISPEQCAALLSYAKPDQFPHLLPQVADLAMERTWISPETHDFIMKCADIGAYESAVVALVPDGWHWMLNKRNTPFGKSTGEGVVCTPNTLVSERRHIGFDEFAPSAEIGVCLAAVKAWMHIERELEKQDA